MQRDPNEVLPPVTDHVSRTVTQIRIDRDSRLLGLVVALIAVPPVVTGLLGFFVTPMIGLVVGVLVGWAVGSAGFFVGYKALTKRVTIDRS
jgi:hypothetical protein